VQSAYNLPSVPAGSGDTVAVVDADNDPTAQSGLAVYRSAFGLRPGAAGNRGPVVGHMATQPPTASFCLATFGIACYRPSDIQNSYDFGPLYANGHNGSGQTIVIFDSFGSPTIRQDLATSDEAFGLPAPPSFDIYMPEGAVTDSYTHVASPVDSHNGNVYTKVETTLDVDWAQRYCTGSQDRPGGHAQRGDRRPGPLGFGGGSYMSWRLPGSPGHMCVCCGELQTDKGLK